MRRIACVFLCACGARSDLEKAPDASIEVAPEPRDAQTDNAVTKPDEWTFVFPEHYGTAITLDGDGNPIIAAGSTVLELRRDTKDVVWRRDISGAYVTSIAYDDRNVYLTCGSGPKAHVDFGAVTLDLPFLQTDLLGCFAKLDATDGHTVWALSPDLKRAPLAIAGSKCTAIGARNGFAAVCGYYGTDFGFATNTFPDVNGTAIFRGTPAGDIVWQKSLSGDVLSGHIYAFHRFVTFDPGGVLWLAGDLTNGLDLVDETEGTTILHDVMPKGAWCPYVARFSDATRKALSAKSFPELLPVGEGAGDAIVSMNLAGHYAFLAGTSARNEVTAIVLDRDSLVEIWRTKVRGGVAGASSGAIYSAAAHDDLVDILRADPNATTTARTIGWGAAQVTAVALDEARQSLYVLGVSVDSVHFEDGTNVAKTGSKDRPWTTFLAKRHAP